MIADFKLIQPRCNAPVALLLVSGLVSPWRASLALQRSCEARTLLRVIAKERLQCRISNALSCLLKTFLTIFECFDQLIDYFVLLLHKKIVAFHAAFACLLLTIHQRMEMSLSTAPTE